MVKYSLTIALLLAVSVLFAKDGVEKTKNIHENFAVDANSWLEVKSSDATVDIQTWDQNKVDISIDIIVRAEDEALAKEFLDAALPSISGGSGKVSVDLTMCGMAWEKKNGSSKVKINGGKWIKIIDFKIIAHIKIPRDGNLDLNASYGKAEFGDLRGSVKICGYDGQVKGGSIGGKAEIKMTYGTLTLGKLSTVQSLKLYESTVTFANLPACTLVSHYSKISGGQAGDLVLDSYEDKLTFESTGKLNGKLTYSTFDSGTIKDANLHLYETKLTAGNIGNLALESHYSRLNIGKCASLNAEKCYEDVINIGELGALNGKGQYCHFTIDRLTGNVTYMGFEDKFSIKAVGSSVKRVEIGGQYLQAQITLDRNMAYELEVDAQYPSLSFPKADFKSSVDAKSDKVKFALRDHVAGKANTILIFTGYEVNVVIAH